YALADADTAAELNRRQAPAPISTLSVALAVAALADPPDVRPVIEERERVAEEMRRLGLEPLPSPANFLYIPVPASHRRADPRARRRAAAGRGRAARLAGRDPDQRARPRGRRPAARLARPSSRPADSK